MIRETFPYESDEQWLSLRKHDLTSTDASSLLGLGPRSLWQLWQDKVNGIDTFIDNEAMRWGRRLEATVAYGIAEDQGWNVRPFKDYIRLTDEHIGSSFDFVFDDMSSLVEIKTVSEGGWQHWEWDEETGQQMAPPYVELQVQHQMLVSGINHCKIAALVGGNRQVIIERDANEAVQQAILKASRQFWLRVSKNDEPEPDFETDAKHIIAMMQSVSEGKTTTLDDGVLPTIEEYCSIKASIRALEKEAESIKAQLLMAVGDAERASCGDFNISASTVHETEVSYTRKAYRNFRVTQKKGK